MKAVTAEKMRDIDFVTINERKVESTILMEKAGSAVYNFIIKNVKDINKKKVLIVAGSGNNGGDALVTARLLLAHDITVRVFITGMPEKLSKDNSINYNFLLKIGIKPEFINSPKDLHDLEEAVKDSDLIIDGIFGTGLNKTVKGIYLKVIEIIIKYDKEVVSVDMPSGICADTGRILGNAVMADYTVTFGLPKMGHFLSDGLLHRGKLAIENIGFTKDLLSDEKIKNNMIDSVMVKKLLPVRPQDAHKGSCGKVLVIGGSAGYTGAPLLSAIAALRSGAGLAGICVPSELNASFEAQSMEVITHPVKSRGGHFSVKAFNEIKNISKNYDVILIGPGIGRHPEVIKLTGKIIKEINLPKVVDADALYALAALKSVKNRSGWVLTPHPLEFARLLKKKVEHINTKLLEYIKKAAKDYNAVIVYKKHCSIICNEDRLYFNDTGNNALATAGSGDVLSGMTAAFMAQGLNSEEASVLSVYLHGACADKYIKDNDALSMLAGDIINLLGKVIKKTRDIK
ncbi:MAG: NAD(P)H-hydrate dehydratase [Armatimonadota bacterium]